MRSEIIDIIKGISIIMIVNVHLLSGQFFLIGSTYHVIAFFFVAGLVHGMKHQWDSKSITTFSKEKVRRLGYPYMTLSFCFIITTYRYDFFLRFDIRSQ